MSLESLIKKLKGCNKGSKLELKNRYDQKAVVRSSYLTSGKEFSRITLPYLLPETDGNRGDMANDHGFNGFNAQCINSLANRLVHNLFPAHQPFFSLELSEDMKEDLVAAGYKPEDFNQVLIDAVKKVHDYEVETGGRSVMVEVMKHLLVSGNVCLFVPPDGGDIQAIPLSNYITVRDSSDHITEFFTMQKAALSTFSLEMQELVKANSINGQNLKLEDEIELITWAVKLKEDKYTVVQTANDVVVKKPQTISKAKLPWIPLRWNTCYGEDYGRGLVEDQYSDFRVMEFLNEARMQGMVLMSDVKYLVRAGATTDIDEVSKSPTGEFIVGSIDDIGVLQLEKYADFTPIVNTIKDYERRVGQVFLMFSAVQRDAERVTAYELRLQAQELNETQGGAYSRLAVTLQRPYVNIILDRTDFPLSIDKVRPKILTGLDALAKASDLDKIRTFTETLGLTLTWPQPLQDKTNLDKLAAKVAQSLGLSLDFFYSDEELASRQQSQQDSMMEQQLGMEAAKAAPKVIEQATGQLMGANG